MRGLLSLTIFIFALVLPVLKVSGQDTIVLMNGKTLNGHVLEIKESTIKYGINSGDKQKTKTIKSYRVFAVTRGDGTEEVIFKPDTIDEADFTVDQLRIFIKGEAAAQTGYHNNLNMAGAFLVGAGSSFFSIYGLVGPAIYSSIVGSVSPDIYKQKNTDPGLINNFDYQEGYLTVARGKKIRNSYVAGMLGYIVGFTVNSIVGSNSKK